MAGICAALAFLFAFAVLHPHPAPATKDRPVAESGR